jgi:hypothetical protein
MRTLSLNVLAMALFAAAACSTSGGSGDGTPGDGAAQELDTPAPLLCQIDMRCQEEIGDEPKTDCALRVLDGEGLIVYEDRAGVERRGRSSQGYDKPNYGLELRDAGGAEKPTNLLGMGGESDWILDGLWLDRSLVRNELVFALFRGIGRWAPRGRYCELALNGEPRGIYRLGERIKRDDDRIDIPDDDGTGESFVIKQDQEGALHWDVGEERNWKLISPNQERATEAQRRGAQDFLDELDDALHEPEASELFALLDVDAAADFVIAQELAKSVDSYNLSLHLWKAPGAPAQLVPWDFDLSMGQPISDIRPGNDLTTGWVWHRTLLSDGLSELPEFRSRLAERWREHRRGPLRDEVIFGWIDRALETLTPAAVQANFERWPLEDVSFEHLYAPYAIYPIRSHAEELQRLRAWLARRTQWMDEHIDEYPAPAP